MFAQAWALRARDRRRLPHLAARPYSNFGCAMISLSFLQARRRAVALVVVSLNASAAGFAQQPQHAGHDTTMSNMPGMATQDSGRLNIPGMHHTAEDMM